MSTIALLRLSLVRFGASLMVVLTTGVINRVFIVDLGYAALPFTFLLSLQQLATPLTLVTGYWSDRWAVFGRHRVPHVFFWAIASAVALGVMTQVFAFGDSLEPRVRLAYAVAAAAMLVFGLGIKASNLLVSALLVDRLPAHQRAPSLIVIWAIAILGLVVGGWVFPVVFQREQVDLDELNRVTWATCLASVALAAIGLVRIEPRGAAIVAIRPRYPFWPTLRALLRNRHARRFFAFLGLADFSFFCQDLILEVFGGKVFGANVSDTTQYNLYYGLGTLIGMAFLWSLLGAMPSWSRGWELPAACALGAVAFAILVGSALLDRSTWVVAAMFVLGFSKGLYNAALANAVMQLIDARLAGLVLGLWGATSGLAIAAGMFGGEVLRQGMELLALGLHMSEDAALRVSFAGVFAIESLGLMLGIWLLLGFRLQAYREQLEHELREVFLPGS